MFLHQQLGVGQMIKKVIGLQIAKSIAAMKSIGCKEEGVLRLNCSSYTGRRNSIVLSILKTEWFQEVKQQLLNKIIKN